MPWTGHPRPSLTGTPPPQGNFQKPPCRSGGQSHVRRSAIHGETIFPTERKPISRNRLTPPPPQGPAALGTAPRQKRNSKCHHSPKTFPDRPPPPAKAVHPAGGRSRKRCLFPHAKAPR